MLRVIAGSTPNKDCRPIPVEFIVLHYTACSLQHTLSLLTNPEKKASTHLILDSDGCVHELVPCLGDLVERAWHAGKSRWKDSEGREWEGFNDFSIGIEIVNLNGNVFPYSDAQYTALSLIIRTLQARHPSLRSPHRIVGHEDIAGFRGKSDPGALFDWKRLFRACYPTDTAPRREPRLHADQIKEIIRKVEHASAERKVDDDFWTALSLEIEQIKSKES